MLNTTLTTPAALLEARIAAEKDRQAVAATHAAIVAEAWRAGTLANELDLGAAVRKLLGAA